ncbi:MAG: 50S ribosomal protein L17 [Chlamydiales bacterium]|nr:50S ribosomal protein L17 [Chlamydiales bacterium]
MRHRKATFKVGRTGAHRRCMIANMLKSLIINGRIQTTITKAKELRRHADRMVTLAKKNDLASRRLAIAKLMVVFNSLTPKEARAATKDQDKSSYNNDRLVIGKLFDDLGTRFATRQGGYTRIIRMPNVRQGDSAPVCLLEYLTE